MKRIVFLTGTRADFGKLKSLIEITIRSKAYDVHIFVTGMHMNVRYGKTVDEIIKCGYPNIFMYHNHNDYDTMDVALSSTILGFSRYVKDVDPDLIIIHGDRVEALAGALVGSLNNILTAHIEGGELSGTIDELIRHSVTKMCHLHFVSNKMAKKRLIQLGEEKDSIYIIGSPDIDIMLSDKLPSLDSVKKYYEIPFQEYAILMFHPVTTEFEEIGSQSKNLADAVIKSKLNYIVIYPNNDRGADFIFAEYKRFAGKKNIRIFPSLRFEYFLVLLKNAKYIIGNSSSGIIEAPYYGIPTVNIGTRQQNRYYHKNIINSSYKTKDVLKSIHKALNLKLKYASNHFGEGNSSKLFVDILNSNQIWETNKQKQFNDLYFDSLETATKKKKVKYG